MNLYICFLSIFIIYTNLYIYIEMKHDLLSAEGFFFKELPLNTLLTNWCKTLWAQSMPEVLTCDCLILYTVILNWSKLDDSSWRVTWRYFKDLELLTQGRTLQRALSSFELSSISGGFQLLSEARPFKTCFRRFAVDCVPIFGAGIYIPGCSMFHLQRHGFSYLWDTISSLVYFSASYLDLQ